MVIPELRWLLAHAHAVSIPLSTPFRGVTHREVLIWEAPDGLCEWAPFVEYDEQEAARWLAAALEAGWNRPVLDPAGASRIRVNGILGQVDAAAVPAALDTQGNPLCVKVKVAGPGFSLAADLARVEAVRAHLGPAGRIRLDANGYWTLDEAEHAIRAMEHVDIDYVEQPVEALADMAELRRRLRELGIQVAADESIRRWSDIDAVVDAAACDIAVVKIAPLGGVRQALSVIEKARAAGVEVVLSSALDTSIGISQAAALQAHLEATHPGTLDAGLGTVSFFARDVVRHPLVATAGVLEITPPELDPVALEECAMGTERTQWWRSRLERAYALLEAE